MNKKDAFDMFIAIPIIFLSVHIASYIRTGDFTPESRVTIVEFLAMLVGVGLAFLVKLFFFGKKL